MSQPSTQRPPQVTLAGSVVIFASVLVVLSVWEHVSNLRSLESREAIERFLASPTGSGTGLDVEGVIRLSQTISMVAAGCATATAALGWYVMRRDKTARLVLSVLAVPLFLSGLTLADSRFASSFVAAGAAMLWIWPAREWFDTGQWTPPPSRKSRAVEEERRTPWPPARSTPPSRDLPPPGRGAGPPTGPATGPAGQVTPYAGSTVATSDDRPGHPHPWGAIPRERPRAIVSAVAITTTLSVLVALFAVLSMVLVGTSPELLMEEVERQQPELLDAGLTVEQVRTSAYVGGALCLVLCAIALTFAAFVALGREWARRGLMLTAAFCAGACLLAALTSLVAVPLVPGAAAIATVVLLARPESRAWCRSGGPSRRS